MRHLLPAAAVVIATAGVASAQAVATDYNGFVPTTELYTATGEPPETALVQRLFTLAFTEPCSAAIDGAFGGPEPQVFDFTYRGTYDEPTDPERKFRLYQFNCNGGAYNFSSVFYGWDELNGLQAVSLAAPAIKPGYKDADTGDGTLISLQVTGMTASALATNAEVDATTGTISATGYWRGIGDASSSGVWELADGEYVLKTYDVDASYDGEVNPLRVFDRLAPEDIELPQ